jgi:hypothetical protein
VTARSCAGRQHELDTEVNLFTRIRTACGKKKWAEGFVWFLSAHRMPMFSIVKAVIS